MNYELGIKKQHSTFNIQNFRRGFTLMEMVIVLGIFTIVSTAATSIFLSSQKASRRTVGATRIGNDARFVMEKMVEDIRLGTVDYGTGSVTVPTKVLRLTTIDGYSIEYAHVTDATICGAEGISCITISRDRGTTSASMTPKGINVKRLAFYVWPINDPFLSESPSPGQPQVTIILETESAGGKKEEQARLSLQTTVSTRVYKR